MVTLIMSFSTNLQSVLDEISMYNFKQKSNGIDTMHENFMKFMWYDNTDASSDLFYLLKECQFGPIVRI